MKRALLLFAVMFSLNLAFAQNSKISLGFEGQLSYLLLTEPHEWAFGVTGYEPGTFAQIGTRIDFRISKQWSVQTGIQFCDYRYKDTGDEFSPMITTVSPISSFLPIDVIPVVNQNRQIQSVGVPLLIRYHLEDLVPGKIGLSLAVGLTGTNSIDVEQADELDLFRNSHRKLALDGQIGPEVQFYTRSGRWHLAPVLRMALTNYSNLNEFRTGQTATLRPYSIGLQAGYSWNL